jgi:hypothetical protein
MRIVVAHAHSGGTSYLKDLGELLAQHPRLMRQDVIHRTSAEGDTLTITLLGYACCCGLPNVLRLLLDAGVEPEPANLCAALEPATDAPATDARLRLGRQACALMLVAAGVDVHAPLDDDGNTALVYAIKVGGWAGLAGWRGGAGGRGGAGRLAGGWGMADPPTPAPAVQLNEVVIARELLMRGALASMPPAYLESLPADPCITEGMCALITRQLKRKQEEITLERVRVVQEQLTSTARFPELSELVQLALGTDNDKHLRACMPHLARELYDPACDAAQTLGDVAAALTRLYAHFQTKLAGGIEAYGPLVVDVGNVVEALYWRTSTLGPNNMADTDEVKRLVAEAAGAVRTWKRAFTAHDCWLGHVLRMVVLVTGPGHTRDIPRCLRESLAIDPELRLSVALHRRRLGLCANQSCPAPLLRDLARCPAGQRCAAEGCAAAHPGRCAGCEQARYCGAVCQRADWDFHKLYCRGTPEYAAYRRRVAVV